MSTSLTRIRTFPVRYRARWRDLVRAYTLVNERDEDWIDEFHAHRLTTNSVTSPVSETPAETAPPLAPSRPRHVAARRRSALVSARLR